MISCYLNAVVTRVTDDPLFHFYLDAVVTRVTDDLIFHCYLDAVATRVTDGLNLAGGEAPITGAVIQMFHIFFCFVTNSVADPGCLSRILLFIHPGFRIPDPTTATKKERKKATNIPKL